MYRQYHPECDPTGPCGLSLQAWIAIFGATQLIISQLPDISSLREINLVCTFCTVCFAVGCVAMSIYNGGALTFAPFPPTHMDIAALSPHVIWSGYCLAGACNWICSREMLLSDHVKADLTQKELTSKGCDVAGYTQVDRTTITYSVEGEAKPKIFNIMFALGM